MDPGRSRVLDWARAAAIVLVLLRHGYLWQVQELDGGAWPAFAGNLARNGWLGVDLFFVLSGFLLSRQLLARAQAANTSDFVRIFWYRRVLRILPAYLAVLLPLWFFREYAGDGYAATGYHQLLIHLVFLQDYLGSGLLVTTWSLATEMKFYLLLPLLVLLSFRMASRSRFACFLLAASAMLLAGRLGAWWIIRPATYPEFFWQVRAPFHHALDGLLLGVAAGYLLQANLSWPQPCSQAGAKRVLAMLLLVGGALLISFDWLETAYPLASAMIWVFSIICSGLVLVGVSAEDAGNRPVGDSRVVSWVAGISYPLYLIHYLMLGPALAIALAADRWWHCPQVLFWAFYLISSFALAWVLHRVVEKPFLQLRNLRIRLEGPVDRRGRSPTRDRSR